MRSPATGCATTAAGRRAAHAPRPRLPAGPPLQARGAAPLAAREIAAFIDDDDEVVEAALAAGFPAVLADWVPRAAAAARGAGPLGRT